MTTFGQLTRLAGDQFLDAVDLARRTPAATAEPDVAAALATATGVLARYTDHVATGFGLRRSIWSATAEETSPLLNQARDALLRIGSDRDTAWEQSRSPLAWRLCSAAETLGCALDILGS